MSISTELYCIKHSTELTGGTIGQYNDVTTALGCIQLCLGFTECKAITGKLLAVAGC